MLRQTLLLPAARYVGAPASDLHLPVDIMQDASPVPAGRISGAFSLLARQDRERRESDKYRIVCSIDMLSMMTGYRADELSDTRTGIDWLDMVDGVSDPSVDTLAETFDFAVCYPASGVTGADGGTVRMMRVLLSAKDLVVGRSGFAKNIFGEPVFQIVANRETDLAGLRDCFGLPVSELFLYVRWKGANPAGRFDFLSGTRTPLSDTPPAAGELVQGDLVSYDATGLTMTVLSGQSHTVELPKIMLTGSNGQNTASRKMRVKYNPFLPIRVRDFSDAIEEGYESDTSGIPPWASTLPDGKRLWRDLLEPGVLEADSGRGTDHPFVNGQHYVFTPLTLLVASDLDDPDTELLFRRIRFGTRPSPAAAGGGFGREAC